MGGGETSHLHITFAFFEEEEGHRVEDHILEGRAQDDVPAFEIDLGLFSGYFEGYGR